MMRLTGDQYARDRSDSAEHLFPRARSERALVLW
jgi:hypothetical protein